MAYTMWKLDPALSPVGSFPPVDSDRATARRTLAQAARIKRRRSAEGSEVGASAQVEDC